MVQVQLDKAFEMPQDRFNFFTGSSIHGQKVVNTLEYKKQEVSQASGVKVSSIRYDMKMPIELKERLIEWATAINLAASFFKDNNKTILWFNTPNSLLGEVTPRNMIRVGRSQKLITFIRNALLENKPE